ncbi:MAG: 3-deoxy-7-phosphoheptulonate synthase [Pyrinomonadaceae bacterium]
MLVVMKPNAVQEDIDRVSDTIRNLGFKPHIMNGESRIAVGITGNHGTVDRSHFENLPGVSEAIRITKPYKLTSRDFKPEKSVVKIGNASIGDGSLAIIAGPCAVEDREQVLKVAEVVQMSGAKFFRGGAFKPRTSPYAFQGKGLAGLEILAEVRERFGLNIVTEAMDEHGIDLVERFGDCIQIGARNMQNFSLLKRAGQSEKPVLLKRGLSATLEELLLAAEYIMAEGNYNVVLCERGIRTFANHARNTLDLSIVPAIGKASHLPVLVDPSHGTGKNFMVAPMAKAGIAVGADGLIVEVHPCPEEALCDGAQALLPTQFLELMNSLRLIHEALNEMVKIAEVSGEPAHALGNSD